MNKISTTGGLTKKAINKSTSFIWRNGDENATSIPQLYWLDLFKDTDKFKPESTISLSKEFY